MQLNTHYGYVPKYYLSDDTNRYDCIISFISVSTDRRGLMQFLPFMMAAKKRTICVPTEGFFSISTCSLFYFLICSLDGILRTFPVLYIIISQFSSGNRNYNGFLLYYWYLMYVHNTFLVKYELRTFFSFKSILIFNLPFSFSLIKSLLQVSRTTNN